VVEHSTHHPEIEGSHPATSPRIGTLERGKLSQTVLKKGKNQNLVKESLHKFVQRNFHWVKSRGVIANIR